jgi:hypothetical protein
MERSGTFLNARQDHEFSSATSCARPVGETRSGYHVKSGYPRFARRRGTQHVLDQAISAQRVDCTAFAQVLLSVSGIMWVEFGTEAVVVPPQHALWLLSRTVHAIRMMSPVEVRSLHLRELDVRQLPKQPSVLVTSGRY